MVSKKTSGKKSSTKKSAGKKSSKKSTKKATLGGATTLPIPNLRCIEACAIQYGKCLSKGVDPQLCLKRLRRCIQNCISGGIFVPDE